MVIKYENGKIYKIIGNAPNDPCYVGSTTKDYLSQRMAKHVHNYNSWKKGNKEDKLMSFELFDKYGVENCKIILLETVEAKSKDELRQREQYYIDQLECVNANKAYCTPDDKIQYDKEYRINNIEKIKVQAALYYNTNKAKINDQQKKYYTQNKDIICAKASEYRQANRDIINEKLRIYFHNRGKEAFKAYRAKTYHCTYCDYELTLCKKSRHDNTKLHINNTIKYMKSTIDKYTKQTNMESNTIQHFSLE